MNAPEKAYERALALIERISTDKLSLLSFTHRDVSALTRIPNDITKIEDLKVLLLNRTLIEDLKPISDIKGLIELNLYDTQVSNLLPISDLTELVELILSHTFVSDISPAAKMTRMLKLDLSHTGVSEISPITGMKQLQNLDLCETSIRDLCPIAKLLNLETLSISGSAVDDLTPLSKLSQLKYLYLNESNVKSLDGLPKDAIFEEIDLFGTDILDLRPLMDIRFFNPVDQAYVNFENTAATKADARIAEISIIENTNDKLIALFDYLKDWVPPVPADTPGAREFSYDGDGPIASTPILAETDNPDQRDLQKDLQTKVANLAEHIGGSNELGYLSSSVDNYVHQIKRPLSKLQLKLLYSAANSLRVAYEAHDDAKNQARNMECLPPQIAAALQDVVETHALFYMGFPAGVEIHQTMMSGLTGRRQPDVTQLATDLVEALRGHDDVIAPEDQAALVDDAIAASGAGPSAEIGERSLLGSLSNAVGAVGRFVWAHKGKFSAGTTFAALKWMVAKEAIITQFLMAYQGPLSVWFKAMIDFVRPWL